MEIEKSHANIVSIETSEQTNVDNNKVDQKEDINVTETNRLPRKEFRKLMKKQRKKNFRIEAAKAKQQQEEEEVPPEEITEANKAEEKKRNAERILWEVRERQTNQANAEKKKKQEENERMKKIIQENWEKTVKNIKIPKSITEETVNKNPINRRAELVTSPSVTSVQEDSSERTDYGTEKDQVNCPFYLKTGACRYGDLCGRHHPYPEKSVTILVRNIYEGMPVQLADEDNDDNLEYDEVEAERHYFEFFEDVHTEFQQYGTIVQFKVCNNFQLHLRGNVYVQYSNEDEAERAIRNIRGRWYAGKQLICDYCSVTKWKPAICGYYQRNQCPKGIQCNFLHVYKNPGGLYSNADRDFEDKRSGFTMITENSSNNTVSTAVNKSSLEPVSISSTRSPKRSQSSSSDKSHSHHSTVKRNNIKSRRKSRSKSRSRSHSRSHSRSPSRRSNDKHRHSGYRHHKRDYHGRRHSRRDRRRHHWDKKPDYYDIDVDNEITKKKRVSDDKHNVKRDGNDDRKRHRRYPKREDSRHDMKTFDDHRKNSKTKESFVGIGDNKNDKSSDDSKDSSNRTNSSPSPVYTPVSPSHI